MGWLTDLVETGKEELGSTKAQIGDATTKVETVIKLNVVVAVLNITLILLFIILMIKVSK